MLLGWMGTTVSTIVDKIEKAEAWHCMFKDCVSFSVRKDLFYNNIEAAFIEVGHGLLGTSNNVIIGVIYQPPDKDMGQFNDLISDILSVIKSEGTSCFLLGDYDINLLTTENHSLMREFVNTMYSFSMFLNITKPSREKCKIYHWENSRWDSHPPLISD